MAVWGPVAFGVAFLLLYWQVAARLAFDWWHDDNYSHGFLIIPLALFFVYERRARLAQAIVRPNVLGLIVAAGSLGLLVAGTLGAELFLTRVSMIGVVTGAVLYTWGRAHLRILLFPLAFLLLMVPLPAIVFNQIAFPLQLLASQFGQWSLQLADIPVLREGNVMFLSNTTLEVAEACSGIRSLVSLLTLGIVLGYISDSRRWVRIAMAIATVPVAIVANGLRVAGTGIAAYHYGPDAATGFLHTFSGWLVFLFSFAILFVILRALVLVAPPRRAVVSAA